MFSASAIETAETEPVEDGYVSVSGRAVPEPIKCLSTATQAAAAADGASVGDDGWSKSPVSTRHSKQQKRQVSQSHYIEFSQLQAHESTKQDIRRLLPRGAPIPGAVNMLHPWNNGHYAYLPEHTRHGLDPARR